MRPCRCGPALQVRWVRAQWRRRVLQRQAECHQHARAAIVGACRPQADRETAHPLVEHRADKFTTPRDVRAPRACPFAASVMPDLRRLEHGGGLPAGENARPHRSPRPPDTVTVTVSGAANRGRRHRAYLRCHRHRARNHFDVRRRLHQAARARADVRRGKRTPERIGATTIRHRQRRTWRSDASP